MREARCGDNTAMASGRTFVGIDGCRAGWFCVVLDGRGPGSCRVLPDARAVGELAANAVCTLIDIPIGLPEAGGGRLCDREARRLLGPGRSASVFSAPARCTLDAAAYAQALVLSRRATGRGLSIQAWNIVPKIRAIDALLRERPALQAVLRECHPELCFRGLNGGLAMRHSKKQPQGREERLAVLARHFPRSRELFARAAGEFPRREVALDDILDALACAVTARSGHGHYRTVPAQAPCDGQGLRMEIVCYEP